MRENPNKDLRPGAVVVNVHCLLKGVVVVVTVTGEIDLSGAEQLRAAMEQAAGRSQPGDVVVVDLAEVGFMGAAGLDALDTARQHPASTGLAWRLCSVQAPVQRLLDLTDFTQLLPVYPDLTAAVTQDLPEIPGQVHTDPDNPDGVHIPFPAPMTTST